MILPSLSTSSSWRHRARRQYTVRAPSPADPRAFHCGSVARLPFYRRRSIDVGYAASSWRGLTKASDRQRINSVIDRARRHGYCSPDLPTFDDLCDAADDELFAKAARLSIRTASFMHYYYHHQPHHNVMTRQRIHSLQLPEHSTHLSDCNFLTRMLYKNKNLCGRDGRTICGPQCVPKNTDALTACRKVHP